MANLSAVLICVLLFVTDLEFVAGAPTQHVWIQRALNKVLRNDTGLPGFLPAALVPGADYNGTGHAGDPCRSSSDCVASRRCIAGFCVPKSVSDLSCNCNDPCISGESCTVADDPFGTCISDSLLAHFGAKSLACSPSPSPSPSSSPSPSTGVCIAVDHLEKFDKGDLVFDDHAHARVLCDSLGNCATRGHIVEYKGRAMMMGSYCATVGCSKAVKKVNSPRYRRGLKLDSRSPALKFTAFAARFETRSEEMVLSTAVRAGL